MLTHYTWDLAYFDYEPNIITDGLKKVHVVKNPFKKKWFADPFILENTDEHLILLVEEFDSSIQRGRIAQIIIDKLKKVIVSCDIILDLPTHLSFPAIYRYKEQIIVHPENSASGASYMYSYDKNAKLLVNPIKVLDEPITDAVIIKSGDEYIMYATRVPESNGSILRLYVSKNFWGPYIYRSAEKYHSNHARMAGKLFEINNKKIRPAQDCNGAYGKAVIFYDRQSILGEIRPHSVKYAGVHTFNTLGTIGVIDLKRYDYPLFIKVKDLIKKVLWGGK